MPWRTFEAGDTPLPEMPSWAETVKRLPSVGAHLREAIEADNS